MQCGQMVYLVKNTFWLIKLIYGNFSTNVYILKSNCYFYVKNWAFLSLSSSSLATSTAKHVENILESTKVSKARVFLTGL